MNKKQLFKILKVAINISMDGFWITDSQGNILQTNEVYAKLSGYSVAELLNMSIGQLDASHNPDELKTHIEKVMMLGNERFETRHRHKDGHEIDIEVSAIFLPEFQKFCGFFRDITERKRVEEEIKHLAFYDQLTGLPNRRLLLERLNHALASCYRNDKKGALFFIDLDNFKNLNDTLGHDMGDLLLQQVAERLVSCVRECDTVARLAGDEFVVMLEDLSNQSAEAIAEVEFVGNKILTTLNQNYRLDIHDYRCTSSIGAALFDGHENDMNDLIKRADTAMYQAKIAGRNALRFFNSQWT